MSDNKSVRKELEKIYGKGCMFRKAKVEEQIDAINKHRDKKITTYSEYTRGKRYTEGRNGKLSRMITYHHLKHKSEGGKATVENGANVNRIAHDYIHSLPRQQEEIINNMLRKYKRDIDYGLAEIQNGEVVNYEVAELDFEEVTEIKAYDNTEKDIVKRKRKKKKKSKRKGRNR